MGGINLYMYVGDDPLSRGDPWGLEWTVDRNGGNTAKAVCCDDTVEKLAYRIGLNPADYTQWLQPDDGLGLPNSFYDYMPLRRFRIPNTVVAYWGGFDWIGSGKDWVYWDDNVAFLRFIGFHVVTHDHVPGNVQGLAAILRNHAAAQELHGLYFWGHGSIPYPAKHLMSHHGSDIVLTFATLNLPYKMALGLIFACDSNSGCYALSSGTPGHKYHGYTGTLIPLPRHSREWIVAYYIPHRAQETK